MRQTFTIKVLFAICIGTVLFGCAHLPERQQADSATNIPAYMGSSRFPAKVKYTQREITSLVEKKYHEWAGTRHRMGGNSKKGIDCSGYVNHVYGSLFELRIPRSTKTLAGIGARIDRSDLAPGDLVFFKPHSYPRHVGVYVGKGMFMHASTSKGVMLSSLNSTYWRKHYWMSRKIILPSKD
jgi:cell wall-associated NlpC family hydrolase